MDELEEKTDRIARLCHDHALQGILLTTQANFAWMTTGRSNRIDGSTEQGNGGLLITAQGRRLVVANAIEMPRLLGEALAGLAWEPAEYPWVDDYVERDSLVRRTRAITGNAGPIGVDWPHPEGVAIGQAVARSRSPLTRSEVERYRTVGRAVGAAVGGLCHTLEPGLSEREVARRATDAVASVEANAVVVLVAADERIARYRHPVPTDARWQRQLLLVVCAERDGLVVALSRLVCNGRVPPDLAMRTAATAAVFERLLEATCEGASGRDLFAVAMRSYAALGFAGEEQRHHQGGAIGYRPRDWIAHPASEERVHDHQAFAWNPSITGTKVEDTALLVDGRLELITASPGWPSIPMAVHGSEILAPAVMARV